jgi:hypothetical protein
MRQTLLGLVSSANPVVLGHLPLKAAILVQVRLQGYQSHLLISLIMTMLLLAVRVAKRLQSNFQA